MGRPWAAKPKSLQASRPVTSPYPPDGRAPADAQLIAVYPNDRGIRAFASAAKVWYRDLLVPATCCWPPSRSSSRLHHLVVILHDRIVWTGPEPLAG